MSLFNLTVVPLLYLIAGLKTLAIVAAMLVTAVIIGPVWLTCTLAQAAWDYAESMKAKKQRDAIPLAHGRLVPAWKKDVYRYVKEGEF